MKNKYLIGQAVQVNGFTIVKKQYPIMNKYQIK